MLSSLLLLLSTVCLTVEAHGGGHKSRNWAVDQDMMDIIDVKPPPPTSSTAAARSSSSSSAAIIPPASSSSSASAPPAPWTPPTPSGLFTVSSPPLFNALPLDNANSFVIRGNDSFLLVSSTANNGESNGMSSYLPLASASFSSVYSNYRAQPRHLRERDDETLRHLQHRFDRMNRHAGANATAAYSAHHSMADSHKDKKSWWHAPRPLSMSEFYVAHAQCRQCTAGNVDLFNSQGSLSDTKSMPTAIQRVMKWCVALQPRLRAEQSPLVSKRALADFEGVCAEANMECPAGYADINVLSPATCANDEPATKLSCALCTLDQYTWVTSNWALRRQDNYQGECVTSQDANNRLESAKASSSSHKHLPVLITSLDSCPVSSWGDSSSPSASSGGNLLLPILFVTAMISLVACACVRRRRAMRLAAASAIARSSAARASVAAPVAASSAAYPAYAPESLQQSFLPQPHPQGYPIYSYPQQSPPQNPQYANAQPPQHFAAYPQWSQPAQAPPVGAQSYYRF